MDRTRLALLAVVGAATIVRATLAAALPLVDDEAYYWSWAQHLAAGYPDHPPAVAWLIAASTALLGDSSLGVRAGAVALSAGIALLLFDLGRAMFGPRAGLVAAVAYQLIPAFSLGSIFAFPDAPFVFAWLLTLWAVWRARSHGRAVHWYLAGLAAGLAALSKLHAVFLAVSMAGFVLWTPSERPWRRRAEPYRAAAIALVLVLPVSIWNAAHEWATFRRAQHPAPWIDTGVPALNAAAFVAAQLAYYGPLTAPLLVGALAWTGAGPRRSDPRAVFLLWAALPILAVTWLTSFDGVPKPHWHAPGFLVALLAGAWAWTVGTLRRRVRALAVAGALLNLAAIVGIAVLPFRPDYAGAGELWGWREVAERTEALLQASPARPGRFLLLSRYQTAGQMDYHLRGRYRVATTSGGDAYAIWNRDAALLGWNAIFLNDLATGPGAPLERIFERVERLEDLTVTRGGRVFRRFSVFRGLGFRGRPRPRFEPL
ncbi:MAG TPA: glycosyltransferase family 39 protein [bacterium]|nr:glycosyltransferase family 39 protein [bacterium]